MMKEEGGDDVDDDEGGSRKISITIYLISCKEIKNPNNCIQMYTVFKKKI
jgi:hypothetical protein